MVPVEMKPVDSRSPAVVSIPMADGPASAALEKPTVIDDAFGGVERNDGNARPWKY